MASCASMLSNTAWVAHNIEGGQAQHTLRMVERHAVTHSYAAVMTDDVPRFNFEIIHECHHVLGHGAFTVNSMIARGGGRLATIAVAAHIWCDDPIVIDQLRRYLVPEDVGLRIAMQQQERWTDAGLDEIDLDAIHRAPFMVKTFEHFHLIDLLSGNYFRLASAALVKFEEIGCAGRKSGMGQERS